jgi:hypothetical protein
MRDKYIKAIRDMLEEMSERDVKFIYTLVQLVFLRGKE